AGSGAWRGADQHARASIVAATAFLRALSLTAGGDRAIDVVHGETGAVIIPPAGAGYGVDVVTEGPTIDASTVLRLAVVDRPAVPAPGNMFGTAKVRRPRPAFRWGPGGSGRDTAILTVARTARMHGFVPIDARLLDTHRHLLHERSLFVIERRVERQLRAWL